MAGSIDLHSHTTTSDGLLAPAELVAKAVADGVTTLAVTDHDTLGGLEAARAAATGTPLRIVDGIELSVSHGGKDFHVLGLFVDRTHGALAQLLQRRRTDRVDRAHDILAKLRDLGIDLPFEAVQAQASDDGAVGRPHVARAMVAAGHVGSLQEAFDRYLKTGAPAYVPYPKLTGADGIAAIHAAGGVASLAHPAIDNGDALLESFVEAGIDAVEAYHPSHDGRQTAHFERRAAELQLLTSGGSDFHGTGKNHAMTLGVPGCPPESFAALEALATRAG